MFSKSGNMINMEFLLFRNTINGNRKNVLDFISENYIQRVNGRSKNFKGPNICLFCGSPDNITREHVLPRWVFDKNPKKWFTTTINGLQQSYEQTTVPCCQSCNTVLLNNIEKEVNRLLTDRDLKTDPLTNAEAECVVSWFELIDFKFQVISITRQFVAHKEAGYNSFLTDYPLSILDAAFDYSPSKVLQVLRKSMRRMTIKSKKKRINSLVVFKTSNQSFDFFNKMNDFIYIEMPHKKAALFYFYNQVFDTSVQAHDEALEKIKENYYGSNER